MTEDQFTAEIQSLIAAQRWQVTIDRPSGFKAVLCQGTKKKTVLGFVVYQGDRWQWAEHRPTGAGQFTFVAGFGDSLQSAYEDLRSKP